MEDLKRLGLSPYEIKIYTSLLQYGRMSAREIADKSGVPPTAVYPNLKRLVSRNFVQELSGELSYFEPVDPAVVIPAFIQNKKKSLDELEIALVEQTKVLFHQKQQVKWPVLEEYARQGIDLRYYPLQNFSLLIVDGRECKITLKNPEYDQKFNLHIKDPSLSEAMQGYFLNIWEKAKPLSLHKIPELF